MLLLDTCTLLWLAADPGKLSLRARNAIRDHVGELYVSAISALEIGLKHRSGRLVLPLAPAKWFAEAVENHGLDEIPVTGAIAALSTELPPLHHDPCDRILVATAHLRRIPIATPDKLIAAYPVVKTLW